MIIYFNIKVKAYVSDVKSAKGSNYDFYKTQTFFEYLIVSEVHAFWQGTINQVMIESSFQQHMSCYKAPQHRLWYVKVN